MERVEKRPNRDILVDTLRNIETDTQNPLSGLAGEFLQKLEEGKINFNKVSVAPLWRVARRRDGTATVCLPPKYSSAQAEFEAEALIKDTLSKVS